MNTETAVAIQQATIEDIEAIAALLAEMRGTTIDADGIREQFTHSFANTTSHCVLIARSQDNTPLGMLVINLVYKLPKIEARIDEVIVAEAARGKGVGTLLMDAAEDWAWKHGANEMGFTSRPSREAANRLYQKLGYELRDTNVYRKKQPKSED